MVKLTKQIFNSDSTENLIDRTFSEVKREEKEVTTDMFMTYYNRLFFDLSNTQHKEISERSLGYIEDDTDFVDSKDQQIDGLNKEITRLEIEIEEIKLASTVKDLAKAVKEGEQEKIQN